MRQIRVIAGGLVAAILLTNVQVLPLQAQPRIPKPPITNPNLLGKPAQAAAEPPAPAVKAPITDPASLGEPAAEADGGDESQAQSAGGVQTNVRVA